MRHELAQLLGFDTYADKSLATKMAESPEQVIGFLSDLAKRARPQAEQELAQLRAFAKQHYGVDELEAWDITYYGENRSSTCSPSATSSCACTSRNSGWWKGCSKW